MAPRLLPIVLAAAVLGAACGDAFQTAAAVVNRHKIQDEAVQRGVELALTDPQAAEQLGTGRLRERRLRDATRLILSVLIQEEIIRQYAEQERITIDAAEVDANVDQIVVDQGGEEAFERVLRERGLSIGDVRENVERVLLFQAVQEQVVARAVSEAELRAEYDARSDEFIEVHVAHIALTSLEDAERVRAEVTPDNFARLARQESADTSTASSGGDLGFLRLSEFPPALAEAVRDAPLDEIRGPVETDLGFEIFRVLERRRTPFASAKDELLAERRDQVFGRWLRRRMAAADIQVNPRYGRLDLASGRIVPITTTESPREVQLTP
jgi:foldase protein PrsA